MSHFSYQISPAWFSPLARKLAAQRWFSWEGENSEHSGGTLLSGLITCPSDAIICRGLVSSLVPFSPRLLFINWVTIGLNWVALSTLSCNLVANKANYTSTFQRRGQEQRDTNADNTPHERLPKAWLWGACLMRRLVWEVERVWWGDWRGRSANYIMHGKMFRKTVKQRGQPVCFVALANTPLPAAPGAFAEPSQPRNARRRPQSKPVSGWAGSCISASSGEWLTGSAARSDTGFFKDVA